LASVGLRRSLRSANLCALPSKPVQTSRATATAAARDRRRRRPGTHDRDRTLALPVLPVRVYRLPRLSYFRTSVTPVRASLVLPESISIRLASLTNPACVTLAAWYAAMSRLWAKRRSMSERSTVRRSGDSSRFLACRRRPCSMDLSCGKNTNPPARCTGLKALWHRTSITVISVAFSCAQRAAYWS